MKAIRFAGPSLRHLRAFPEPARRWAAYEIYRMQQGMPPVTPATRPFGDGPARLITKKRRGAKYWIYHITGPAQGEVLVFGAAACFCHSPLERECIGTSGAEEAEPPEEGLFQDIWDATEEGSSAAMEMRERSDLAIQLSDRLRREKRTGEPIAEWGVPQSFLQWARRGDIDRLDLERLRHAARKSAI